jgi:hypothetical protein
MAFAIYIQNENPIVSGKMKKSQIHLGGFKSGVFNSSSTLLRSLSMQSWQVIISDITFGQREVELSKTSTVAEFDPTISYIIATQSDF